MQRPRGEPVKKQFFAGTACPSCRALDKVRRCEDAAGVIWLECLACGYTQDLTEGYVDPDETAENGAQPVTWRPR
ncbi:MAG: YheV family putative metal-binding protein [Pseudomonadota bacterium]